MKTIQELEKEFEVANTKWKELCRKQTSLAEEIISKFQDCEICFDELLEQLSELEGMDDEAYTKRHKLEMELRKLKQ